MNEHEAAAHCCHSHGGGEAQARPVTADLAGKYICPMCPGVESIGPAVCPECGMALEPESPSSPVKTVYTCPMHPEVAADSRVLDTADYRDLVYHAASPIIESVWNDGVCVTSPGAD